MHATIMKKGHIITEWPEVLVCSWASVAIYMLYRLIGL